MAQGGRLQRAVATSAAVVLMAALLVATGVTPARAGTTVTAVTGSALGYHAFGISLFGGAQPDTGPTPTEALAANASNSPQSGNATTALVQYGPATLLSGDAISLVSSGSLGTTGSVSSSATATDLNKATTQPASTGSEVLTADSVAASCSASGSGTSGSATETNASMVTDNSTTPPTVTPVPTNPAPNTSINGILVLSASDTETFTYVFNEQTTVGGVLTVNAVDEYLHGPTAKGNVIVGQAVCGVSTATTTPQTITYTSTPPSSAVVGGPTYTVTATGGGSGNPVVFTIDASASSVCTISGATVSFTAPGSCVIDANQAGNATFDPAPQAQQSFAVGKGAQAITFTSTVPSGATVGGPTYTVTATGGASGNPVTFTIDSTASSVCSISGATVSFTAAGTCKVDANQAGSTSYNAAPQAQQSFGVGKANQTITFTSTAPTAATVGGPTYAVTATASSGLAVAFTIPTIAGSVCSISGSTVSFIAAGMCVIDANQAGNANFNAAPQMQQSFAVGKGAQTISFTSAAPSNATPGGPTYTVTATASSGLAVTFTIDSSASSVCSVSGSTVTFAATGTCVIDANQAGNANFNAAPQAQQSFAVGKASQTITFTSTAPAGAVVAGATYTVTATASSGLAVTFTIDASAASVCSISSSTVSFTAVGTCVIDANQAGNANFNAAPQAQQSFAVAKGAQNITFTSTAPTTAVVGGPTYNVTATGGASGNAVTFTIASTSASVCSISGSTVSFTGAGMCLINANQLGNANYNSAPQTQQSFTVGKGSQAITFTSTAPTSAVVGGATYAVTASGGASGNPVTFTIDATAAGVCSVTGSTVSFTATGTCVVDANQAGNSNYNAAPQKQQSFAVGKGSQTITFTSTAPTNATPGGPTYTVTASGGASGNPVLFTIDSTASSVCSISGSTVSFTAAGTCVIDANEAGNADYNAAPQAQQSFGVGKASQTITFTSTAPTGAVVAGPAYTVAATASSGLAVTFTIDSTATSVCSISGATVSFTGAGTCVIDANQAGNGSFNAAPQAQQSFAVGKGSQTITFTSTAPTNATPGGPTYTVTASGGASGNLVALTIDSTATSVCSISGSTVSFTASGTCVINANQAGNANFNAAPQAQQSFGVGKAPQTITFTSTAPTSAVVGGPTYAVAATASSGLAVTFTIDASATSMCSISGATVSFTAAGTCVIDANQAGNGSFNAAPQVQQSFVVGKGSQAITFTSTAPSGAVVGGPTYSVTATGGASGNAVTFTIASTSASVCAISGSTVSFIGAGTCLINANQAGNANFNAAPQTQQSFTVGKGSQAITFTSTAPTNATPGGPTYTVTASGGASGNPVLFTIDSTSSSVCSISGSTVSFTAAGTCVIDANEAGNADYNAAPQAQQSFGVGKASQTITFTSSAPTGAAVAGPTYTVAATASSGLAVTFTIDSTATSVCSISGATVSFTGAGTCVIDANQAGNGSFNAAPQAQQSFAVGKGSQTITFTSTAPTNATPGGPTYTVTATASSGLPVTLTIDSTATSVCAISGSTVSFTAAGACVIDANQAGNANFNAAPQAQQSFAVGKGSQTITFTSSAPANATPGGPTYTVTATASSGLAVTFAIDSTATSVCSISGSTVSFTASGTCVIDANQAGNANFNAAPQVQQSFGVGKTSQTITFTSTAPTSAVVGGPTYTVAATASSGLAVTFTIDSSATSVCSISGATVSFTGAGTCVIDANQAGNGSFNPAPQVQQTFAVGKGSQTITFTSTAPTNATPGGPTYTVAAIASSGLTAAFTIDASASSVCSISGATVSFTAAGTCVIDANQAGNANYNAAPQVQQSFGVGKATQTITFTSKPPSKPAPGGTYTVAASASSGLPVIFTIDPSAASVCSISGSVVSFTTTGTCVIDANQPGDANFNPAPQVQQSFAVGKSRSHHHGGLLQWAP